MWAALMLSQYCVVCVCVWCVSSYASPDALTTSTQFRRCVGSLSVPTWSPTWPYALKLCASKVDATTVARLVATSTNNSNNNNNSNTNNNRNDNSNNNYNKKSNNNSGNMSREHMWPTDLQPGPMHPTYALAEVVGNAVTT